MEIANFVFSPWAENTYVIFDETGDCCIVDPGCNDANERKQLSEFIESKALNPVKLVNTHCHIDHVLGNQFVAEKYGLELHAHEGEQIVLDNMVNVARMYGVSYEASPSIAVHIEPGAFFKFGNTQLEVYFTPGHSPASISFFHRETNQLIVGDVLFKGSIGRTDLPGGDHETLIRSIKEQLFPLGDEVVVYNGHGEPTTIGNERMTNPFLI